MPFFVALILSAVFCVEAYAGQGVPPPPPARDLGATALPAGATAIIRGRVVTAAGEPVRRATVLLQASDIKLSRSVATDADGRFEFQHLPAARITLRATKTGFVAVAYGQKRPFQPGRGIDLAAGQALDKIDIVMPRAGVIAGRVVNDLGEPSPGVMVAALRRRFGNGGPSLAVGGTSVVETDDLGQYRVGGLPSGSFYIMTSRPGGAVEVGSAPIETVAMGNTFHPSAASAGEAKLVTVRPGQEVRGIDITQMAVRPCSISGTLLDSSGHPVSEGTITLQVPVGSNSTLGFSQMIAMTMMEGRWMLKNALPADYVISAEVTNSETRQREVASVKVSVAGMDIDNVVLQAVPPARVTGRVLIESESPRTFAPSQVRIGTVGRDGRANVMTAAANADWTFELKNVSTEGVRVSVPNVPPGWGVQAIRMGDVEVTDRFIETGIGATVAVNVVLTDRITSLSGKAVTAGGAAVPDAAVLVFSADPGRWPLGKPAVVLAQPNQAGTFTVSALPPGAYYAIALEYVDDGEEGNPEFLEWARSRAARVDLEAGKPLTTELTLVKYEGGL